MKCKTPKVLNITDEGNNNKILQNSMYEQEYNMVFTDSALWAGLVVDSPCSSVCVSVTLCHLSHVNCHMSPITCNVSHGLFHDTFTL